MPTVRDSHHRSTVELEEHLDDILSSPLDNGVIEMIVRRPDHGEREIVDEAELSVTAGLVGDNWRHRVDERGVPNREAQLTLMNSRAISAIAGTRQRWPLAGDQVYVDMDLSVENLPPGTLLRMGDAVIEVSASPHTGCAKFSDRFGREALRFANVGVGRERRFRGLNAVVTEGGTFQIGDRVSKVESA